MPREKHIPGLGRLPKPATPELVLTEPAPEGGSKWEVCLLSDLRRRGVPEPSREYRFHPDRGWRFDLAFPAVMLAVEVQGGLFPLLCRVCGGEGCEKCAGTGKVRGRHVDPKGFADECRKRRAANVAGWCLLEYPPQDIESGFAAREIALVYQDRVRRLER